MKKACAYYINSLFPKRSDASGLLCRQQSAISHVSWEKAGRSRRVLRLTGARKDGQRLTSKSSVGASYGYLDGYTVLTESSA